ncbi:VrrA/YqfQ family protein [Bacillus cytotoxicus]
MYPKSPIQQMHTGQQPYTPYPIPHLPPMMQKKKGLLSKLFKKHDPTEPFMQMIPPYRQMEGQPMMHQQYPQTMHPHYNQPYMHQPMSAPPMYDQSDMRGGESFTATNTSGGIGSFFSNLIANPTNMLNNIEKVAQFAQSVGPVVEQYGPIVRSIPSIVKILTSGKGDTENPKEEVKKNNVPKTPLKKKKRKEVTPKSTNAEESQNETTSPLPAKPKLYV